MILLTSFVVALTVSLVFTPLTSRLAFKWGLVDGKPGSNGSYIPVMGGIAVFLGFGASILTGMFIFPVLPGNGIADTPMSWQSMCLLMLLSGLLITVAGFIDDKYELSPGKKLLLHSVVAVVAGVFFVMNGAHVHLFLEGSKFSWMVAPITMLWLLGITNSVNLLDHADGITSGVTAIAAFFFAALNYLHGNPAVAYISVAVAGASLGFLFFNFPPASVYMGDSGSNFLGFILAVVAVLGIYTPQDSIPYISVFSPILILAIPIIDTIMVILYRKKHHMPILHGDKNHLAHRIMRMGYSRRVTAVILYLFSGILGTMALLLPTLGVRQAVIAFINAVGVVSVFTVFIAYGGRSSGK